MSALIKEMFQMGMLEVIGNSLLFILVFGMSATVDIRDMMNQLHNKKAIFTTIVLQFVLLPFLGFITVKILNMSHAMGITLLVVTSSPGGSYSNWWCSLFNADLALSVTMTAISTLLSVIMLPLNLLIYAKITYKADVIANIDWVSLFTALIVVILAIFLGLLTSAYFHSFKLNMIANKLGNFAGLGLVLFSGIMSNGSEDSSGMFDRSWKFYFGVAMPCLFGLLIANLITKFLKIKSPERVTVSIECCYQNVGIATSVALTMFEGDDLSEAMGVPLYYGTLEALILGFYCIGAWKSGWTKAPVNERFWLVLITSYEVLETEQRELQEIEVSISTCEDIEPERESDRGDTLFHYINFDNILREPSDSRDVRVPKEPSGYTDSPNESFMELSQQSPTSDKSSNIFQRNPEANLI